MYTVWCTLTLFHVSIHLQIISLNTPKQKRKKKKKYEKKKKEIYKKYAYVHLWKH